MAIEISATRMQLQAALIAAGASLPAEVQTHLANALTKASPVDAVVNCYDALRALPLDTLAPSVFAALRAAAECLAEKGFHGRAAEAADLVVAMNAV